MQLQVGRQLLDHVALKRKLEQMLRDLIEEAGRCDLVPKPTSLWWTGTYDPEERIDVSIYTTTGCHKFPFEEKFRILGNVMNRQGKSDDAIGERMQSANKAFWKDILISKRQDVPWKVKCRRLVDHVYAVFAFGSENWPWTVLTVDKIKGWEIKGMLRLFRFKRRQEEAWVDYHARTCKMARNIWTQMALPFLYEEVAESMWRAMGLGL